jgi:hypothetical protein
LKYFPSDSLQLTTAMIQGKITRWPYLALGGHAALAEFPQMVTSTAQCDTSIGVDGTQVNVGSRRLYLQSQHLGLSDHGQVIPVCCVHQAALGRAGP